jgi:peptidyl-prolyl cis-trans isomerase A (cyclophilin A)
MFNPRVWIETDLGNILLELYPEHAPLTVTNFLRYVDEDCFDNACFYRVVHMDNQPDHDVKIEVIQGGLKDDGHPGGLPPIPHETTAQTRVTHKVGTISMARNQPGSASSEFFICINDQPELDFGGKRNPDEGMDVVKKIQSLPADGQYLIHDLQIKVKRGE